MRTLNVFLFVLFSPVLLSKTYAESAPLAAGEYITEAGWGQLKITPSAKRLLHFSIETVGGNAHTCSLSGVIQNQQAVLDGGESNKPCIIKFLPENTHLNVTSVNPESCRFFCGARASFEGLYFKPAAACTDVARRKTRQQFDQLYAKKAYAEAVTTLEPLLSRCEKTLDWLEAGQLRNDLAITQYHLGRLADCQKTLAVVQANVGQTGQKLPLTEQGLSDILPPSDFENYLPIAKATWHNSQLCAPAK